ncbi:HTH-type transcriptional regulator AcrR [Brevundimonas sp. SH203]|uniref:TetR/AcrR family transcriptional regulator n=1 Tax=Brevundimonas sp. SH203 TaxID=345167 RepID=UPI0009D5652D|nr:TetR/AcrR family transcriptional regulator [Brevundimonas sp. SH203]GAW40614.1 HTH-type transcriptional regulator AcrR [Brevundimonas sp. SH203]
MKSATSPDAGARRASDTPQKLLDAVVRVVFQQGYAGATMTLIAKEAGVTRGAIQHYFGDKRVDLMAAVCAHLLERRQKQYRDGMQELVRADFPDARAQLKVAYRDPETWFLVELWIASRSDAALRDKVDLYLKESHDLDDRALSDLLASEQHGAVDFRIYKYFMRALTRGLALEHSRRPDAAFFDAVADFAYDAVEASLARRHGDG